MITAQYTNAERTFVNATLQPGDHLASENVQAAHTIQGYTYTIPAQTIDGHAIPARTITVDPVDIPAGQPKTLGIPCNDNNPVWVALKALEKQGLVEIADAPPPPPPPIPDISDRQFFTQLALDGVITEAEAEATADGTMPAMLMSAVDTIPDATTRFVVRMAVKNATIFQRHNEFVPVIQAALGWSDAQLDSLWERAALL